MKYFCFPAFALLLLTSCSKNIFYQKVSTSKTGWYADKYATKTIFNRLNDSISASSRVIYVYQAINHLPTSGTKDFQALVYDYGKQKTYFFQNEKLSSYQIESTAGSEGHRVLEYVLKNYMAGKTDHLKSIQNKGISEGGLGITHLFDVNPAADSVKQESFDSIILDKDGKPTNKFQ